MGSCTNNHELLLTGGYSKVATWRESSLLEPPKRSPRPHFLTTVDRSRRVLACRLPQRRNRVPSGAGRASPHHPCQGRAGGSGVGGGTLAWP
jgi:hypothetical protein